MLINEYANVYYCTIEGIVANKRQLYVPNVNETVILDNTYYKVTDKIWKTSTDVELWVEKLR